MPRSRAIDNALPRRAVKLQVDANLLREAREISLNLSATLERARPPARRICRHLAEFLTDTSAVPQFRV